MKKVFIATALAIGLFTTGAMAQTYTATPPEGSQAIGSTIWLTFNNVLSNGLASFSVGKTSGSFVQDGTFHVFVNDRLVQSVNYFKGAISMEFAISLGVQTSSYQIKVQRYDNKYGYDKNVISGTINIEVKNGNPITGVGSTNPNSIIYSQFVEKIPNLMRQLGWNTAASLQDHWFQGSGQNITLPVKTVLDMDGSRASLGWWKGAALVFEGIESEIKNYDDNNYYGSGDIENKVKQFLPGVIRQENNKPNLFISDGSFDYSQSELDSNHLGKTTGYMEYENGDINEKKLGNYIIDRTTGRFNGINEFIGAFARAAIRVTARGYVKNHDNESSDVTITGFNIYLHDYFDFRDIGQSLGCWTETSPYVHLSYTSGIYDCREITNDSYRYYNISREKPENYGEFRIFTDPREYVVNLKNPKTFNVKLTQQEIAARKNLMPSLNSAGAVTEATKAEGILNCIENLLPTYFPTRQITQYWPQSTGETAYGRVYDNNIYQAVRNNRWTYYIGGQWYWFPLDIDSIKQNYCQYAW